ncbi:MAG: chitobiase/beta-hexosaminidase C-terminal domain-containing protein, partial [Phocaeicola sp.]
AVQPASNLNLSSVLFASAATAASSDTKSEKITDGTAMTLRLDGTGEDIGTVTYNTTTGDIKAVKGSTSQAVALVVQGNDGTNDWYYSKQITGTDTVNVTAIEAETNTPASIDLSTCKIWLEITGDNVTYAVNATETVVSDISSVAITDIETPVSNTALDTEASCVTEGVSSTTPQITWTPSDTTAGYNTSYTASITLTAATGYEFTDSTTATVMGNAATSVKNPDGTLMVTYAFPATAKDKLTSITAPQAITVANGTAYSAMNLPEQVNIVTEGNTVSSAPVTWNTTTPASGSYDPSVLTEQTVTLNGMVDCPTTIDTNGVSITTTITITISAAGIVGAPTANPTAGTYSENQSVTLTSSTEGASIYYTTDGSEPTITGGVTGGTTQQYTAPILVTGTEGQSITTTIKAIAVKNGMQDSSVETFTYTIQIPVPKYTVTVTNGSGTGQYAQGETVTITAGAAPSGQQFKEWEVVSGTITLASSTSETTTFTMPAEAVSVKANYEAVPVTGYTITATAGANGSITPSGAVGVAAGGSQTFTISPSSGYVIDTLKVDSLEVTATTSYTFSDVNSNHTIEVTFKQESQTPDVPGVTAPSITTQPGNATVKVGETATFTIAASGTDLTYQWQIDRNDGNGWVNIAGAIATSYTTSTVDMSCNGFKYQCVVSNSAGTVTSNTAVLTVTENTTPDPDPVDYEILDGANSSWEQNSDGSLSIRGSGEFSKFVGVKVDGNLVDAKNYTVKEGSTIVTLKADYLNTLSVGSHTFEMIWTDGTASTNFTIKANTSDNSNNNSDSSDDKPSSETDKKDDVPKTGDNTPIVWLFILSILSGTGLIITVKKRRENLNS